MEDSYGTGFTSSLYRLQKQGVPLIFPMNREEILRAVQTNSKISKRKYGKNFTKMKNTIRREVTRGISTSMSFGDIARNIDNTMNSGLYNSYRVARTEGHRINQEASFDAMTKAKEAGADVVKKWDSTLDSRTRPHHSQLEGQIRELDEPFEVAGLQAMYPSGFGKAEEDINCRCVVLEIGRWELDEDDTYSKFDGDSGVIVSDLSNTDNYQEFRKKYSRNIEKAKTKTLDDPNELVYDFIEKEDIQLGRSLSAKANTPKVKAEGKLYNLVEGSKITKRVAFAGYKNKKPVVVAEHLTKQYGGRVDRWQHVRGEGIVDFNGKHRKAELHWFENDDLEEFFNLKVKRWRDES